MLLSVDLDWELPPGGGVRGNQLLSHDGRTTRGYGFKHSLKFTVCHVLWEAKKKMDKTQFMLTEELSAWSEGIFFQSLDKYLCTNDTGEPAMEVG